MDAGAQVVGGPLVLVLPWFQGGFVQNTQLFAIGAVGRLLNKAHVAGDHPSILPSVAPVAIR